MGTMAERDRKARRRFSIVAGFIVLIIASLFYFNIGGNYFHYWYQQAGGVKYFSYLFFALAVIWVWLGADIPFSERQGKMYGIVFLILMAAGFFTAAGFNFDLP